MPDFWLVSMGFWGLTNNHIVVIVVLLYDRVEVWEKCLEHKPEKVAVASKAALPGNLLEGSQE